MHPPYVDRLACRDDVPSGLLGTRHRVQWTPDGSVIYFSRSDFGNLDGSEPLYSLFLVNADEPGGVLRTPEPALVGYRSPQAHLTSFDVGPDDTGIVTLVYAACFDQFRGRRNDLAQNHGFELVVQRPEGSVSKGSMSSRITTDDHFDSYPVWSPDGRLIAFLASRDTVPPNDLHTPTYLRLEVIQSNGGGRRLVDTGPVDGRSVGHEFSKRNLGGVAHIPPRWSPDGKRLAFVVIEGDVSPEGDGSYAIVVIGVFDKERQRLTRTVSAPTWSPDGLRVAFARATQDGIGLYTIRPDGTDVRILTRIHRWEAPRSDGHLARVWVRNLAWSPDGERLLYTWENWIHVVDLDGSARSWRLGGSGGQPAAAWSPDGSRIAVALLYGEPSRASHASKGRVVLYTVAADGSDRRDLVHKAPRGGLVAAGTRDGAVR